MATDKSAFIPSLVQRDEAVREYARRLLGIAGEEDLPAFLTALLASGTPAERQAAAQAIGGIGGGEFSEMLLRVLESDEAPGVRASVVLALGRTDYTVAVGYLFLAMHDPAEAVRNGAVAALGQLDPLGQVSNFVLALHDTSAKVWLEAARAVAPSLSPAAVPALSVCLADPYEDMRVECARVLTAIGAIEAVPAFLTALQEPNPDELLVMAAGFLGNHGGGQTDVEVIPALARIVGRWNHLARPAAARALGQLGDLRAVPALLGTLDLYDSGVPPAVIDSLGVLGGPDAVERLVEVVRGTHGYYAGLATEARSSQRGSGAGRGHYASQGSPAGQAGRAPGIGRRRSAGTDWRPLGCRSSD